MSIRSEVLPQDFFNRPAQEVARDLLGKFLVRKIGAKTAAWMITEVEAYDGVRDRASHASRGKTARNAPMFGPPGHWYVYFTYGMHWMLNVVTREPGHPAAILIRGIEGAVGPARLTKALKIDKRLNALPADRKTGLWIEDCGKEVQSHEIKTGPRVGVPYAGPYWSRRKWRFRIKPSPSSPALRTGGVHRAPRR